VTEVAGSLAVVNTEIEDDGCTLQVPDGGRLTQSGQVTTPGL
jgi:hypothetical protein